MAHGHPLASRAAISQQRVQRIGRSGGRRSFNAGEVLLTPANAVV
jgi:hypothetical protein